jgi:hypothetical protein
MEELRYFGNSPVKPVPHELRFEFVATAGQVIFSCNYTPLAVDVFQNGSLLVTSAYTATNGVNISLGTAASLNDKIIVITRVLVGTTSNYTKTESDAKYVAKTSLGASVKRGYQYYMGNK